MRLGSGRVFGFLYLAAWCAALAGLVWFMADLNRLLAIGIALVLLFLAPDLPTLRRLLSGKDDDSPNPPH